MVKKLFGLIITILCSTIVLFGCGDPYKNMNLILSDEVVDLYIGEGDDLLSQDVTANVTGAAKGVRTNVEYWLSGDENITITTSVSGSVTTLHMTAKNLGHSLLTLRTIEGNIKREMQVNVYRKIESVDFASTDLAIANGGSLDLSSVLNFTPADTNQRDLRYEFFDASGNVLNEGYTHFELDGNTLKMTRSINLTDVVDGYIRGTNIPRTTSSKYPYPFIRVRAISTFNETISSEIKDIYITDAVSSDDIKLFAESLSSGMSEVGRNSQGMYEVVLSSNTAGEKTALYDRRLNFRIGDDDSADLGLNYTVNLLEAGKYTDNSANDPVAFVSNLDVEEREGSLFRFRITSHKNGTDTLVFRVQHKSFPNLVSYDIPVLVRVLAFPNDLVITSGGVNIPTLNEEDLFNDARTYQELNVLNLLHNNPSIEAIAFNILPNNQADNRDARITFRIELVTAEGVQMAGMTFVDDRSGRQILGTSETVSPNSELYIYHNILSGDMIRDIAHGKVALKITANCDMNPQSAGHDVYVDSFTKYIPLGYYKNVDTFNVSGEIFLDIVNTESTEVAAQADIISSDIGVDVVPFKLSTRDQNVTITSVAQDSAIENRVSLDGQYLFSIWQSDMRMYAVANRDGFTGQVNISIYDPIRLKNISTNIIVFSPITEESVVVDAINPAFDRNIVLNAKFNNEDTLHQELAEVDFAVRREDEPAKSIELGFYNVINFGNNDTRTVIDSSRVSVRIYAGDRENYTYLSYRDSALFVSYRTYVDPEPIRVVISIRGYNYTTSGEGVVAVTVEKEILVHIYQIISSVDVRTSNSDTYDLTSLGFFDRSVEASDRGHDVSVIDLSYDVANIDYDSVFKRFTITNFDQVVYTYGDIEVTLGDLLFLLRYDEDATTSDIGRAIEINGAGNLALVQYADLASAMVAGGAMPDDETVRILGRDIGFTYNGSIATLKTLAVTNVLDEILTRGNVVANIYVEVYQYKGFDVSITDNVQIRLNNARQTLDIINNIPDDGVYLEVSSRDRQTNPGKYKSFETTFTLSPSGVFNNKLVVTNIPNIVTVEYNNQILSVGDVIESGLPLTFRSKDASGTGLFTVAAMDSYTREDFARLTRSVRVTVADGRNTAFHVADVEDFLQIGSEANNGFNYMQTKDISLPANRYITDFAGSYDGLYTYYDADSAVHYVQTTIANLNITSGTGNIGLFAHVASNATIKNIVVLGAQIRLDNVTSDVNIGILSGNLEGELLSTDNGITRVQGSITVSLGSVAAANIGGVIGKSGKDLIFLNNTVDINNADVEINITGSATTLLVGGIAGDATSSITGAITRGVIKAENAIAGGIAGRITGKAINDVVSQTVISGGKYVGGIVGELNNANVNRAQVEFITSEVSLQASEYVGSIAGHSTSSDITASYGRSYTEPTDKNNMTAKTVGGIVGLAKGGTISQSYFDGYITYSESTNQNIGYIIGADEETNVETAGDSVDLTTIDRSFAYVEGTLKENTDVLPYVSNRKTDDSMMEVTLKSGFDPDKADELKEKGLKLLDGSKSETTLSGEYWIDGVKLSGVTGKESRYQAYSIIDATIKKEVQNDTTHRYFVSKIDNKDVIVGVIRPADGDYTSEQWTNDDQFNTNKDNLQVEPYGGEFYKGARKYDGEEQTGEGNTPYRVTVKGITENRATDLNGEISNDKIYFVAYYTYRNYTLAGADGKTSIKLRNIPGIVASYLANKDGKGSIAKGLEDESGWNVNDSVTLNDMQKVAVEANASSNVFASMKFNINVVDGASASGTVTLTGYDWIQYVLSTDAVNHNLPVQIVDGRPLYNLLPTTISSVIHDSEFNVNNSNFKIDETHVVLTYNEPESGSNVLDINNLYTIGLYEDSTTQTISYKLGVPENLSNGLFNVDSRVNLSFDKSGVIEAVALSSGSNLRVVGEGEVKLTIASRLNPSVSVDVNILVVRGVKDLIVSDDARNTLGNNASMLAYVNSSSVYTFTPTNTYRPSANSQTYSYKANEALGYRVTLASDSVADMGEKELFSLGNVTVKASELASGKTIYVDSIEPLVITGLLKCNGVNVTITPYIKINNSTYNFAKGNEDSANGIYLDELTRTYVLTILERAHDMTAAKEVKFTTYTPVEFDVSYVTTSVDDIDGNLSLNNEDLVLDTSSIGNYGILSVSSPKIESLGSNNEYRVTYTISISFNKDMYRIPGSTVQASEFSVVFNPRSNPDNKVTTLVKFDTVKVEKLQTYFYPSAMLDRTNTDELELNESPSGYIVPGRTGLLKINALPAFASIDQIEVRATGDYVPYLLFNQYVARYDGDSVLSRFDWYSQGPDAANVLVARRVSNVIGNVFEYDGSYYIRIILADNAPVGGTLQIQLLVHSADQGDMTFTVSMDVVNRPEIAVQIDGSDDTVLAAGMRKKIDVQGSTYDNIRFNVYEIDAAGDRVPVSDSRVEVVHEGDEYYLVSRDTTRFGYTYFVEFTAEKMYNGMREEAIDTIRVQAVKYEITGFNISGALSGHVVIKNSATFNLYMNISTSVSPAVDISEDFMIFDSVANGLFTYYYTVDDVYLSMVNNPWYEVVGDTFTPLGRGMSAGPNGEYRFYPSDTENNRLPYILARKLTTPNNMPQIAAELDYYYDSLGYPRLYVRDMNLSKYYARVESFTLEIQENSTYDHPNPIFNVDDFMAMNNPEAHYILVSDLVLNNWRPLAAQFATFDGNGKVITINSFNTTMDSSSAAGNYGIFTSIPNGAVAKNITVDVSPLLRETKATSASVDLSSFGQVNFGVLAATNSGTITNCKIVARDDGNENAKYLNILTGPLASTNIGGIVATNAGSITNSSVGLIYINGSDASREVYINSSSSTISTSEGDETWTTTNSGASSMNIKSFWIVGNQHIGGVASTSSGVIASTYVNGVGIMNSSSTTQNTTTGGFVAENSGTIFASFVQGIYSSSNSDSKYRTDESIFIETKGDAGAFLHTNSGSINDCYSAMNIKTNSRLTAGFVYRNANGAKISYCYTTSRLILGDQELQSGAHGKFTGKDSTNTPQAREEDYVGCYYLVAQGEYEDLVEPAKPIDVSITFSADNDNIDAFSYMGTYYGYSISNSPSGLERWYMSSDLGPRLDLTTTYSFRELEARDTTSDMYNYTYDSAHQYGGADNPLLVNTGEEFVRFITNMSKIYTVNNEQYYIFGAIDGDNEAGNAVYNVRLVNNFSFGTNANQPYNYIDGVTPLYLSQIIFAGKLDGNGMTMRDMDLHDEIGLEGKQSYGLFKSLGLPNALATVTGISAPYSIIKDLNITVTNVSSPTSSFVGTLGGVAYNTTFINTKITGNDGSMVDGRNVVGGLVGAVVENSSLKDVTVSVSASSTYTASISDTNSDIYDYGVPTYVTNTNAYGELVMDTTNGVSYTGGVAGILDVANFDREDNMWDTVARDLVGNDTSSDFESKTTDGLMIKDVTVIGNITLYGQNTGGVFGYIGANTRAYGLKYVIPNTLAEGRDSRIQASNIAGGVVAELYGVLEKGTTEFEDDFIKSNDISNRGGNIVGFTNIFGRDNDEMYPKIIGGLVGQMQDAIILDSYSKINVVNSKSTVAGGLVGKAHNNNYLLRAYTTGYVYAGNVIGGAIGVVTSADETCKLYLDYLSALNRWDSNNNREVANKVYNLYSGLYRYTKNTTTQETAISPHITRMAQIGNQDLIVPRLSISSDNKLVDRNTTSSLNGIELSSASGLAVDTNTGMVYLSSVHGTAGDSGTTEISGVNLTYRGIDYNGTYRAVPVWNLPYSNISATDFVGSLIGRNASNVAIGTRSNINSANLPYSSMNTIYSSTLKAGSNNNNGYTANYVKNNIESPAYNAALKYNSNNNEQESTGVADLFTFDNPFNADGVVVSIGWQRDTDYLVGLKQESGEENASESVRSNIFNTWQFSDLDMADMSKESKIWIVDAETYIPRYSNGIESSIITIANSTQFESEIIIPNSTDTSSTFGKYYYVTDSFALTSTGNPIVRQFEGRLIGVANSEGQYPTITVTGQLFGKLRGANISNINFVVTGGANLSEDFVNTRDVASGLFANIIDGSTISNCNITVGEVTLTTTHDSVNVADNNRNHLGRGIVAGYMNNSYFSSTSTANIVVGNVTTTDNNYQYNGIFGMVNASSIYSVNVTSGAFTYGSSYGKISLTASDIALGILIGHTQNSTINVEYASSVNITDSTTLDSIRTVSIGLLGKVTGSTIDLQGSDIATSAVTISNNTNKELRLGAVIGSAESSSVIFSSSSAMGVTITASTASTSYIGGIGGYLNYTTFEGNGLNLTSSITIASNKIINVGGAFGSLTGRQDSNKSIKDITVDTTIVFGNTGNTYMIGGFAGRAELYNLSDIYADVDITLNNNTTNSSNFVAGLIGKATGIGVNNFSVTGAINLGTFATNIANISGIANLADASCTFANGFTTVRVFKNDSSDTKQPLYALSNNVKADFGGSAPSSVSRVRYIKEFFLSASTTGVILGGFEKSTPISLQDLDSDMNVDIEQLSGTATITDSAGIYLVDTGASVTITSDFYGILIAKDLSAGFDLTITGDVKNYGAIYGARFGSSSKFNENYGVLYDCMSADTMVGTNKNANNGAIIRCGNVNNNGQVMVNTNDKNTVIFGCYAIVNSGKGIVESGASYKCYYAGNMTSGITNTTIIKIDDYNSYITGTKTIDGFTILDDQTFSTNYGLPVLCLVEYNGMQGLTPNNVVSVVDNQNTVDIYTPMMWNIFATYSNNSKLGDIDTISIKENLTFSSTNNIKMVDNLTVNVFGNNHTISGLKFGKDSTSLFGTIASNTSVKQFTLVVSVDYKDTKLDNQPLGFVTGTLNANVTLDSINIGAAPAEGRAPSQLTITMPSGVSTFGAIVGSMTGGSITNCHVYYNLTTGSSLSGGFGGLVGSVTGGTITNSFNHGTSLSATAASHVGGQVGTMTGGSFTYNTAFTSSMNVTGMSYVGGVIGEVSAGKVEFGDAVTLSGTIQSNSARQVDSDYIGGLIGKNNGTLNISGAITLSTTVTGDRYIGGFIGESNSVLSNNITIAKVSVTGNYSVGGLYGELSASSSSTLNIVDNPNITVKYSSPKVKGTGLESANFGGLVGNISSDNDLNINIDSITNGANGLTLTNTGSANYVGGLVGNSAATLTITIDTEITLPAISGKNYTGGLVGASDGVKLSASTVSLGELTGSVAVGGIVGSCNTFVLSSALTLNVTKISASDGDENIETSSYGTGGLVGNCSDTFTVNTNTLTVNLTTTAGITGGTHVGGVVGYIQRIDCNNAVTVTGIAMKDDKPLQSKITGKSYVGGMFGSARDSYITSYNISNLDISSSEGADIQNTNNDNGKYIGGVFGKIDSNPTNVTLNATNISVTLKTKNESEQVGNAITFEGHTIADLNDSNLLTAESIKSSFRTMQQSGNMYGITHNENYNQGDVKLKREWFGYNDAWYVMTPNTSGSQTYKWTIKSSDKCRDTDMWKDDDHLPGDSGTGNTMSFYGTMPADIYKETFYYSHLKNDGEKEYSTSINIQGKNYGTYIGGAEYYNTPDDRVAASKHFFKGGNFGIDDDESFPVGLFSGSKITSTIQYTENETNNVFVKDSVGKDYVDVFSKLFFYYNNSLGMDADYAAVLLVLYARSVSSNNALYPMSVEEKGGISYKDIKHMAYGIDTQGVSSTYHFKDNEKDHNLNVYSLDDSYIEKAIFGDKDHYSLISAFIEGGLRSNSYDVSAMYRYNDYINGTSTTFNKRTTNQELQISFDA